MNEQITKQTPYPHEQEAVEWSDSELKMTRLTLLESYMQSPLWKELNRYFDEMKSDSLSIVYGDHPSGMRLGAADEIKGINTFLKKIPKEAEALKNELKEKIDEREAINRD